MKFQTYKVKPQDNILKIIQVEDLHELSKPDTLLLIQVGDTNPETGYEIVDILGSMGLENVIVSSHPLNVAEVTRQLTMEDGDNEALQLLQSAAEELKYCERPDFGVPEVLIEKINNFLKEKTSEKA